jgi:uncharacterized protein
MTAPLIAHAEIPVKSLETAKKFYDELFGWEFKAFGNGYYLYNSHAGVTIGLKQVEEISKGNSPIFHINVADIEATIKKAEELGGKTEKGKTVIPVYGYYGLIKDIDGNTIGLYETH